MAQDPYKYFRIEAHELLSELSKAALDLEKKATPQVVARLLRSAHTLKGAARVVKQGEIADKAHALEDVLVPYRESSSPVPRENIDRILGFVDEIGKRVALLALPPTADEAPSADVAPIAAEPLRTVRADVTEVDDLLDGIGEAHAYLTPMKKSLSTIERAKTISESLIERVASTRANAVSVSGVAQARSLAEELASILSGLEQNISAGVTLVERELGQMRHAAERMRLVPTAALFTTLERTARDSAQALGKHVVFEGRGGDVRLDAHLLGTVQAALVQVVRNAVAHGVENEVDRRKAGKNRVAHIILEVARRGRFVVLSTSDDGGGVDLDAVRRVAQRKGLPGASSDELGADEILKLLVGAGITTSPVASGTSGRGVGLDIVRETAERLGGEVVVRSERGKGTTVELTLPMQVASIDGLVVSAGDFTATIPLDAVRGTVWLHEDDVARGAAGESIVHEGEVVPFRRLAQSFGALRAAHAPRSGPVVLVRASRGTAAFGVDRLLGTENVVVRPLPELAPALALVGAASLDAEGNPRLVLEPEALVQDAFNAKAPTRDLMEKNKRPVLVVDDSLTTRMLERSILESAGYAVDVATSAEEALEKAKETRYALFLVDIEMPGMDGFTFVATTRADPAQRDVPAILVSSRASSEDFRRGQEVGASHYMVKSEFDQGILLDRIRTLVERSS